MKRVVLLFVIVVIGTSLTSRSAEAQRSGSLQVTARVLDTRDSRAGLESARAVVNRLADAPQTSATVETSLTQVSVQVLNRPDDFDRPRTATVTINYLRN